MDQIQSVDNDLQKAIDNITNTTNIDPVFSDPVATPSPDPVIPLPNEPNLSGQTVPTIPEPPIQEPTVKEPLIPELSVPTMTPEPDEIQPTAQMTTEMITEETSSIPDLSPVEKVSANEIKKAALRDLAPLLNHVNMEPAQKFGIYRDIFEDLQDCTVLDSAYRAAREIPNETERAEALLYLIESINKM